MAPSSSSTHRAILSLLLLCGIRLVYSTAAALSAETTAEAERVAALHRTFGNVHTAVTHFFDNLDELLEDHRESGGLAPWHHTHMRGMMRAQRANALEAFAPESHVDALLLEVRAASASGASVDEHVQHLQQTTALHDMIDAMTTHGTYVTEHLRHKDELYALLEEEGKSLAPRPQDSMRFRSTRDRRQKRVELSAESKARLKFLENLMSKVISSSKWLLGVIGRFLRTVLKSLYLGIGVEVTMLHPMPGFVLEACVDMGTWYRYGKGQHLSRTKEKLRRARAHAHAEHANKTHAGSDMFLEMLDNEMSQARSGRSGSNSNSGDAVFVSEDKQPIPALTSAEKEDEDTLLTMTSAVKEQSNVDGEEKNAQPGEVFDEVAAGKLGSGSGSDGTDNDDERFDKQNFDQARTSSVSKRALDYWKNEVVPACDGRANMEFKMCFPLVFTGYVPHKWGIHLVANSVALKCAREKISGTFNAVVHGKVTTTGPAADQLDVDPEISPADDPPTEDPTEGPPTEDPTEDPSTDPTEDPSTDPTGDRTEDPPTDPTNPSNLIPGCTYADVVANKPGCTTKDGPTPQPPFKDDPGPLPAPGESPIPRNSDFKLAKSKKDPSLCMYCSKDEPCLPMNSKGDAMQDNRKNNRNSGHKQTHNHFTYCKKVCKKQNMCGVEPGQFPSDFRFMILARQKKIYKCQYCAAGDCEPINAQGAKRKRVATGSDQTANHFDYCNKVCAPADKEGKVCGAPLKNDAGSRPKFVGHRGPGGRFIEITEAEDGIVVADHAGIADKMTPPDGVTAKRGPWQGHTAGETTGKYCSNYCKPIEGERLCFPKNNKNYKDAYLRDNVLTLSKYKKVIPKQEDRLHLWNHINYCKDACTVDTTNSEHCKPEISIAEVLVASQDAAFDTMIPDYDDTEIGTGDLESTEDMCRQNDDSKSDCCAQAACGYDILATACKARGVLAESSLRDACLSGALGSPAATQATVSSLDSGGLKTPAMRHSATPDKDVLSGLERQCHGSKHGHTCRDTIAIVANLFVLDILHPIPHMFHGVGFDYSMKSCGPFFSKMAMSRLSSQFRSLVMGNIALLDGNTLSTHGDGGPTSEEKTAREGLEAQQLVDKVVRTQENIEMGQCSPNCANVDITHAVVFIAPQAVVLPMLAVGAAAISKVASSDHHTLHHEAEKTRETCNELKASLYRLAQKKCVPPDCVAHEEDLEDLQTAWDEVCAGTKEAYRDRLANDAFREHLDLHHRTGAQGGSSVDDVGISERVLNIGRENRSPRASALLQENEVLHRRRRARLAHDIPSEPAGNPGDGGSVSNIVENAPPHTNPNGDPSSGDVGDGHHETEETIHSHVDLGVETVVSLGPVWDIGKCLFQKMRSMIMGASLKIMGGSDRVCKKPCDEDGTCANVRLKVPDYTVEGTLPNGRFSKLKEINAKCSQVGLVKKHSICSHCMGPGSNCQYDTDCASGWCMGNGYGAFQGKCTDMGRLAGAPCARDNECKSKNCRRGVRSYGVCALTSGPVIGQSGAATGLPECEKAMGRLPGCNCAKSSQCASNFCDGSIVDLALERGACKFTPRPVLATCHAAKTCGDCTSTAAHGVFGVHACVWSIGKVQDQSEIWPGEENEIVVTRREEGCYAAKKSQNWEEQRYIDTAHSSMCTKKDEVTLPRAAKIKHCSEIKAADGCLKCVNQDVAAGLVLKTGTEECVWSIGAPIAGEKGHENWDHLMSKGGKKFGSKEVSRKSGANGGPRCVRRKPSTKSWIMNRYIDRAHKDLCGKQPTPALVEDQGANEAEKCADLTHTGRDAESKCKLCTQNPLCKEGIFTKSSFMSLGNKCRCEAKDEVVQPGWKRDM